MSDLTLDEKTSTQPTHTTTEVSEAMVEAFAAEFYSVRTPVKWSDALRNDIRRGLEAALSPRDGVPGMVLVPKTALDWLFGEGPDEEGHRFGDGNFPTKGAYWWRNPFRAMLSTASSSGEETP